MCAQWLSYVWFIATPWTAAHQPPLSMKFSRQQYWSRLPFYPPGDLPDPGIEPMSPAWAGRFFITAPPGKPTCRYIPPVSASMVKWHFLYVCAHFPLLIRTQVIGLRPIQIQYDFILTWSHPQRSYFQIRYIYRYWGLGLELTILGDTILLIAVEITNLVLVRLSLRCLLLAKMWWCVGSWTQGCGVRAESGLEVHRGGILMEVVAQAAGPGISEEECGFSRDEV